MEGLRGFSGSNVRTSSGRPQSTARLEGFTISGDPRGSGLSAESLRDKLTCKLPRP